MSQENVEKGPPIALRKHRDERLDIPKPLIVGRRDPITKLKSLAGYQRNAPLMEERAGSAEHFFPRRSRDLWPSGRRPYSPRHDQGGIDRAAAETTAGPRTDSSSRVLP
jgi:hypothetical protein